MQSHLGHASEDKIHLNTHKYDPPLVPRHLTRGVIERIDMKGQVVIPLREESARQAARDLIAEDVQGIAISLLHSYKNPTHERRVRDIVLEEIKASGKAIPVFASADYYPLRRNRTAPTPPSWRAMPPSRRARRCTKSRTPSRSTARSSTSA